MHGETSKASIQALLDNDMNVTETLAQIIHNWPSLHTSRLCALRNIFTGDCDDWSKGHPNPWRTSAIYTYDTFETETPKDDGKKVTIEDALREFKDKAEKRFVRSNAASIAMTEYGEWHDFRYVPTFSTYQLNRLSPETLSKGWREALIEFCKEILSFSEDRARRNPNGYSAESVERKVIDLKEAKATAREALNRLGLGNEQEKKDRDTAIRNLRFEASKLGFKLEKVDPENVFG